MQVPDELQPALFNVFVTSALTAVNFTMIVYQVANRQYGKKGKLLLNLHLFQMCLSFAKNVSMTLLAGSTYVDCRATAIVEFVLYYLWAPAMETVLFMRARAFTLYPRALTAIVGTLWVIRIAFGMYAAGTVVALSPPGSLCMFNSDWAVGDYVLICRLISEAVMFGAFAQRIFLMVRGLDGLSQQQQQDRGHGYQVLLRNSFITSIVCITSYAVLTQVVKLPTFAPYTLSVFIIQNMIDSIAVVFILDDTKNQYKKATSRRETVNSGGVSSNTVTQHANTKTGRSLSNNPSKHAVDGASAGSLHHHASHHATPDKL